METQTTSFSVMTSDILLKHWQGHRGLTRKVIEAFPEKELFTFSIGGMRTFADLAMEIVDLSNPGMIGLVTDKWKAMKDLPHHSGEGMPKTKDELLILWDETTQQIDRLWDQLTPERLSEAILAFGMYPGTVTSTIFYFIDNEIHHRGQGYVYLRALGIESPFFWDRA